MEKRSIKEIKLILEKIQTLSDERLTELRGDERKGVQDLIAKFERQYAKKAERAATTGPASGPRPTSSMPAII